MGNAEQPLDPKEALMHIRTLARIAAQSDDNAAVQKHLEMILMLVDRALPPRRRQK